MRIHMIVAFLIALTCVNDAMAQTRFFQRGEAGGTIALSMITGNATTYGNMTYTYTYKGLIDVGLVEGNSRSDTGGDFPYFFLGRVVILQPGTPSGTGLELGGLYGRHSLSYPSYFPFPNSRSLDQYSQAELRFYHRRQTGTETALMIGLSGLYRYSESTLWNNQDELLYDGASGEWGAAIDGQLHAFGYLYAGLKFEYAQHDPYPSNGEWGLRASISLGVIAGLGGGPAQ